MNKTTKQAFLARFWETCAFSCMGFPLRMKCVTRQSEKGGVTAV